MESFLAISKEMEFLPKILIGITMRPDFYNALTRDPTFTGMPDRNKMLPPVSAYIAPWQKAPWIGFYDHEQLRSYMRNDIDKLANDQNPVCPLTEEEAILNFEKVNQENESKKLHQNP